MLRKLLFGIFFLSLLLVSLLASPLVSLADAALDPRDKQSIEDNLQKYQGDATKMTLFLAVVNAKMDLSEEPELRQKVVDSGTAAGVDMSRFTNLVQGTIPLAIQQEQQEEQAQAAAVNQGAQPGGAAGGIPAAEGQGVQPGPGEQVQPVTSSGSGGSGYSAGMIVTLLVIAAILVLIGWLYSKRKKQ